MPNRQEVLYKDFSGRMQPRVVWPSSQEGAAMRVYADNQDQRAYVHNPVPRPKSGTRKLTEAEDNALGRAKRRRSNRKLRGWLPHAKR